MVIGGDGSEVEENKSGIGGAWKDALVFVLITFAIGLLVYLFIKMRRKVRAV